MNNILDCIMSTSRRSMWCFNKLNYCLYKRPITTQLCLVIEKYKMITLRNYLDADLDTYIGLGGTALIRELFHVIGLQLMVKRL